MTHADDGDIAEIIHKRDISEFPPRQRILAAALKLFVEQGYFNTDVPDLSRDSKCSVGSIYHNFKNKEEVARALYQEGIESFRHALLNAVQNKSDVEEVVKTVVKSFLEFSEVNYQLSKYLWLCRHNEFLSGMIHHPTRVGFDRLGRILTRAIKRGIQEGKIKPVKANIMWSVIFGVPVGYVRDWLDGYNTDPPRKVANDLANICWSGLKA